MMLLTPLFHFNVTCGMTSPISVSASERDRLIVLPSGPVRDAATEALLRPPKPSRLTEPTAPRPGTAKV